MKYIISESKLHNTIYKFINKFMNDTEVEWYNGVDPFTHETTEYEIRFFGKDLISGEDGEPLFVYVKEEWFEEIERDPALISQYIDKAPILEVHSNTAFRRYLDGFFGDAWKPAFEKWFENKFSEFPVKTFTYF